MCQKVVIPERCAPPEPGSRPFNKSCKPYLNLDSRFTMRCPGMTKRGFTRCCHSETLRAAVSESNKIGFTLIELLVVVLIIGILSAVALPQYTKAVKKSRAAGVLPYMKEAQNARQLYFMSNGTYTSNFREFDMDLEGFYSDRNGEHWDRIMKGRGASQLTLQIYGNGVLAAYSGDFFNSGFGGYGMKRDSDVVYCAEYACHAVEVGSFCRSVMGTSATPVLNTYCVRLFELP